MRPTDVLSLLRRGTMDPELAALLWLLSEGGVPIVVAGPGKSGERAEAAAAVVSMDPSRPWLVLDADEELLDTTRLAALLRGGPSLGLTLAAPSLEAVFERLTTEGLPEDGVRRLGVVIVLEATAAGSRCAIAHYLRPSERDGQGHVQRRPPAVLAAWDAGGDAFEHYAWGITPELADRVDRAQADFEERQRDRARFLLAVADAETDLASFPELVTRYLATEPARTPAPTHDPAVASPFAGGLTDPDPHVH